MGENVRGKSANWIFLNGEPIYIGKELMSEDDTLPMFLRDFAQKVETWIACIRNERNKTEK